MGQLHIALATFADRAQDIGTDIGHAHKLLSQAMFVWTGINEQVIALVKKCDLVEFRVPQKDISNSLVGEEDRRFGRDRLSLEVVVVVYTILLTGDPVPNHRVQLEFLLSQVAESGEDGRISVFKFPGAPERLVEAGFHR